MSAVCISLIVTVAAFAFAGGMYVSRRIYR